ALCMAATLVLAPVLWSQGYQIVALAGAGLALAALLALPLPARADERPQDGAGPMSAIDWLSRSVVTPAAMGPGGHPGASSGSAATGPARPGEPPVTSGVGTEDVAVSSLDAPSANALGLLPARTTGLPPGLWGATPEAELVSLLRKERLDPLPSIQAFLMELSLAELDPPRIVTSPGRNALYLARVDRLLDLGALDQAAALLEQADPTDAEVFRRHFDVALLLGQEDRACEILRSSPEIAPSFPALIFCVARNGDWQTAALSFGTGRALGQIEPDIEPLLERFLDPELAEDVEDLPPPARPSPLVFRMMEAIGQPMPTGPLPLAFAQADLRANTGWKARIEAAERLARLGSVDANQLFGLYTERRAAASGGVWDRARLMAAADAAIAAKDRDRLAQLLPALWDAMQAQELETVPAALWGADLAAMALPGDAGCIATRMALLGPAAEATARNASPRDLDEALLYGIAKGSTATLRAQDQLGLVLKQVFDAPVRTAPPSYARLIPDRLGEALLAAIDDVTEGARGDYRRLVAGLQMIRFAGLEALARRTALELVILERRG
ncbi:MAG: tetratricopeptide repeat protein, partial [Sphingomonadales bacterium]|nr:tetratricopeptide repeat protein [Sphingomonadales bacterium]